MSATPATPSDTPSAFTYDRWRHGGWYVLEVRYPGGAIGCVSRNYPDRKWRIVCDRRPGDITYRSRDAAARAEYQLARAQHADTSTANSSAPVDNSSQ